MSRALLVLHNDAMRAKAIDWIRRAPKETRVEFKGPKRTIPQNDRMWAMLTELSTQLLWHGQRLSTEDWKQVMLASLKQEMRIVPNIHGDGFVQLGRSSSDLSKEEMGDLMTIIEAFAARYGVKMREPDEPREQRMERA
jgi:hypothetical protein